MKRDQNLQQIIDDQLRSAHVPGARHGTAFLAHALLVRAIREAGVRQLLCGGRGIAGILLGHPDDAAVLTTAAVDLLRPPGRSGGRANWRVLNWLEPRKRFGGSWDDHVNDDGVDDEMVIAFAGAAAGLRAPFIAIADGVATVGRPGPDLVRAAFVAVMGRAPRSLPDPSLLETLPLGAYAQVIRRGDGGIERAAAKLQRLAEACAAAAVTPEDEPDGGPRLEDIHGLGEAADWGRALANDLADYRAGRIGWADVDRGVLLSGPPGTGKTIFARALGRTCGVPVHLHSLARWQAKGYLNDLLKGMRGAFEAAKADAPCIVFVDELDAFGDREQLDGKNRQYSVEVILAFLECLDGAEGRDGVVVVGATNDPANIDAAIRRPGRLDRHILIPLPDREARVGILRHHLRGELAEADLTRVADRLDGASGAAIEQTVRTGRRRARAAARPMEVADLEAGLPASTRLTEAAFRRACVHEAGHLLVAVLLERELDSAPLGACVVREVVGVRGGATTFRRDHGFDRTRASYLAEVTVQLAGLAAERVIIGDMGDGGGGMRGSDLDLATRILAGLELSLGLGEDLLFMAPTAAPDLLGHLRLDPALRRRTEAAMRSCLDRAADLVEANRSALDALAEVLDRDGEVGAEAARRAISGNLVKSGDARERALNTCLAGCPSPRIRPP